MASPYDLDNKKYHGAYTYLGIVPLIDHKHYKEIKAEHAEEGGREADGGSVRRPQRETHRRHRLLAAGPDGVEAVADRARDARLHMSQERQEARVQRQARVLRGDDTRFPI